MICSILPYWMSRSNLGRKDVMVDDFFNSVTFSSELARMRRLRKDTVLCALWRDCIMRWFTMTALTDI